MILFNEPQSLLNWDGDALLFPSFFDQEEAFHFFKSLQQEIAWKQEPILLFGKSIMQPRLTAWYGDDQKSYGYSGIRMEALPFNETLLSIKNKVEQQTGDRFTSALLNYYRDGQDSMGWHRDNEKELGPEPLIASVSFGATRKFQFRHYATKKPLISVDLSNGSLLVMRGKTNHFWEHRIPKSAAVSGARINITFRIIH